VDQESDVPEVRAPTVDDVRRICRSLDEAGARYVLIGGFAVVRVADEVMVDLLAAACGVTWAEAAASAVPIELDGTRILVADRGTLIRTKQTVRHSDAADRAWLEGSRDDGA